MDQQGEYWHVPAKQEPFGLHLVRLGQLSAACRLAILTCRTLNKRKGASLVEEKEFYRAVALCLGFRPEEVSGEALIWEELKLFGGEYVDVLSDVANRLSVKIETAIRIFDYIPEDSEVGLFRKLKSNRSIPDIKLRELYAHFTFSKL